MSSIENMVNNYNELSKKKGLASRLKFDGDLYLGREEQFEYGVHQCNLAKGQKDSEVVVVAMTRQLCFEFGE